MGKKTILKMVAIDSQIEMPPEKWNEAKAALLSLMLQTYRERHKNRVASDEGKRRIENSNPEPTRGTPG